MYRLSIQAASSPTFIIKPPVLFDFYSTVCVYAWYFITEKNRGRSGDEETEDNNLADQRLASLAQGTQQNK